MRISDWSSDVCSSDLRLFRETVLGRLTDRDPARAAELHRRASRYFAETGDLLEAIEHAHLSRDQAFLAGQLESLSEDIIYSGFLYRLDELGRSEEHTSELQSLMRNSYAVFGLKKKKRQHTNVSKN